MFSKDDFINRLISQISYKFNTILFSYKQLLKNIILLKPTTQLALFQFIAYILIYKNLFNIVQTRTNTLIHFRECRWTRTP